MTIIAESKIYTRIFSETFKPNNTSLPIFRVYFLGHIYETLSENKARQVYNRVHKVLSEFNIPRQLWSLHIFQDEKELRPNRHAYGK